MAYTGDPHRIVQELNSLGEAEVRKKVAEGYFGHRESDTYSIVQDWLLFKESEREAALASRSEAREESSLSEVSKANALAREVNLIAHDSNSIARQANSLSRRANIIAIIAMIISALTAIIIAIIESSKP